MFASLIKGIAEYTGKVVGEVTHQTGETLKAISEIPDAFSKGYDEELFSNNEEPKAPTKEESEK